MNNKSLCIRTFAEIIRNRMNEKVRIKNFDVDNKIFQTELEVKRLNKQEVNLSQDGQFYPLLLKSIVFNLTEDDIPDVEHKTMTSQLKNGKIEIHKKIKEIAQRKETKKSVVDFFDANLIPNITANLRNTVLDEIDSLVQNDKALGKTKLKSLKELRNSDHGGASYLAEVWLIAICNGKNKIDEASEKDTKKPAQKFKKQAFDTEFSVETTGDILDKIVALTNKLAAPKNISPPEEIEDYEIPYINALYEAYEEAGLAEAEKTEDLEERRIDYFAAETVRRGVEEYNYKDQFEILKEEIYDGVKDTAKMPAENGYIRMLNVMSQSTQVGALQYIFSRSHFWISNKIRKGVCHFLADNKKIKWVKK